MPAADRGASLARSLAVALLLLAAAFRSWHAWPVVFPADGRVYLVDTDSYFHLRQMQHFPRIVRDDPLLPMRSDAAGLFDLALGLAGQVSGHPARVAAAAPVVLQVACGLLLFALARDLTTPALALWAVLAFVLHPGGSLPVTTLGFADHHAAEMALVLAVLLALHRALTGAASAARAAAPLVAFLFTWLGAPIWVAIVGLCAAVVLTLDLWRADPGHPARARAFAVYAATAAAGATALRLVHPPLVMSTRALNLGTLALGLIAVWAWLHPLLARRVGVRRAAVLGVVVPILVLAGVLAAWPRAREMAQYLVTPKTHLIGEHRKVDLRLIWLYVGAPGVLAAFALPCAWRRPARLVPVLATLLIAGLWMLTRDYPYQASALVPLLAAIALRALPRVPRRVLAGAVFLPLLVPGLVLRPWLVAQDVVNLQEVDAGWLDAAEWLREHAGEHAVASTWDRGNLVAAVANHRAVWARYPTPAFATWFSETDEAASLAALPARFVVVDAGAVSKKFLGMALLAGRALEPYRASAGALEFEGRRYEPATFGAPWRQAVAVRLYYLDGETLERYRLVYESAARSVHWFQVMDRDVARTCAPAGALPVGPPRRIPGGIAHDITEHAMAKVFEVVAGAIVEGRTAPGAPVELKLELEAVTSGRRFAQVRRLVATADGLWRVRVPYASQGGSAVRALGPYAVRTLDAQGREILRTIEVTDADVVAGRLVRLE